MHKGIGKTGMYGMVDTLVNAMEVFHGPGDFADEMSTAFAIPRETLMKVYDAYWKLDVYKRSFGYPESFDADDWERWLKNFEITEV